MEVKYYHPIISGFGNILWKGQKVCLDSDKMQEFRDLGYWASAFPEGDGFCFDAFLSQGSNIVVADIKKVFGWDVKVVRSGEGIKPHQDVYAKEYKLKQKQGGTNESNL